MKNRNTPSQPRYPSHTMPFNVGQHPGLRGKEKPRSNAKKNLAKFAATVFAVSVVGGSVAYDRIVDSTYDDIGATVTMQPGQVESQLAGDIAANNGTEDYREIESRIEAANPGVDMGELEPGQELKIPKRLMNAIPQDLYIVNPMDEGKHQ